MGGGLPADQADLIATNLEAVLYGAYTEHYRTRSLVMFIMVLFDGAGFSIFMYGLTMRVLCERASRKGPNVPMLVSATALFVFSTAVSETQPVF